MVISRPREHLARGQFNSGRMIAPSRSFRTAPLFFSVRLCLSGPRDATRSRVRTRYTPRVRPCDFHPSASLSKGRSALARASAKGRLSHTGFFFYYIFPPRAPVGSFSPLKLFRWGLLLVSIDPRSWYAKLSDRH